MTVEEALQRICIVGRELLAQPDGAELFSYHTASCSQCREVMQALSRGDGEQIQQRFMTGIKQDEKLS